MDDAVDYSEVPHCVPPGRPRALGRLRSCVISGGSQSRPQNLSTMFLGLDTAEWTAIGTVGLLIVTGAYVLLTRKLANSSGEAAVAAQESARSAARSAEATERAVRVAEAALDVDFEAEFVCIEDNTPQQWIVVRATGRSRVFLHRVDLFPYHHRSGEPKFVAGDLDPLHPRKFPISLRHQDTVVVEWPGGGWT